MTDLKFYFLLYKLKDIKTDTFVNFKDSTPDIRYSSIKRNKDFAFCSFFGLKNEGATSLSLLKHIISIRKFDGGGYQLFNKKGVTSKIDVGDLQDRDVDDISVILRYGREILDSNIKSKFGISDLHFDLVINFLESL